MALMAVLPVSSSYLAKMGKYTQDRSPVHHRAHTIFTLTHT